LRALRIVAIVKMRLLNNLTYLLAYLQCTVYIKDKGQWCITMSLDAYIKLRAKNNVKVVCYQLSL